jgi:DNA-binding transcriptional regulator of glucitol operon
MDNISVTIVMLLVAAWLLQIWLSSQQMRAFHKKSQQLRKMGTHMAIGLAGTTYRRKIYSTLVTDADHRVVAAEELGGFTVFAGSKPVPAAVGMSLDEVGRGEPPAGVSAKTWASLDHAAGFIRNKLAKDAAAAANGEEEVG